MMPHVRNIPVKIYWIIRLVFLKTFPPVEIAKAPVSTIPGAIEVLYRAGMIPPATAAITATARLIRIAGKLSLIASGHELKAASCEPATISIIPNASRNEIRHAARSLDRRLNINVFLSAPKTLAMLTLLISNGIDAIEKFMWLNTAMMRNSNAIDNRMNVCVLLAYGFAPEAESLLKCAVAIGVRRISTS